MDYTPPLCTFLSPPENRAENRLLKITTIHSKSAFELNDKSTANMNNYFNSMV